MQMIADDHSTWKVLRSKVMRTPLQILFLILVTDLPPSIALGMEPGHAVDSVDLSLMSSVSKANLVLEYVVLIL